MRFSRAVITSHCFVPKNELRDIQRERGRFTISSRYDSDRAIPIYREVNEWFGFPLQAKIQEQADSVEDHRIWKDPINIGLRTSLYPAQQDVFDAFVKAISHGKTNFIIEAKPGWGKTCLLIHILAHIAQPALVIVPKTDLVIQWQERLAEHTFLKPEEIGYVEGRSADWKGKKVVVALVHSLALNYLPDDFRRYFGQVWFDEVHSSTPPATFAPVLQMFPATIRGGASATLKRQDGLHVVYEHHLGECYLRGSDTNRMVPKVYVLYYPKTSGHIYAHGAMNRRGQIISRLAGNAQRNDIIALNAFQLYQRGYRVLIISDRTEQLHRLDYILTSKYCVSRTHLGYYCRSLTIGKSTTAISQKTLDNTKENAQIILATYGMMKLGTDIPDLSALIYGTPQTDPRQTKGRIERFMAGKKQPIVVDLVDTTYDEAIGWFKCRLNSYEIEGLEIERMEVGKHG